MSVKSVVVIGAGFAGISAATSLASKGYKVQVVEKNSMAGGRARKFKEKGFTFDMGPSWYWMPDVFDRYFESFNKSTSDFYDLIRLDPSYKVVFGEDDEIDLPSNYDELKALFESIESGSSKKLDDFLKEAEYKYQVGINRLVYKPSLSVFEFVDLKLLVDMVRMEIFNSIYSHVRKFFKHEKLIKLMEFPILFLGATAEKTPALYSLMNYADIVLGTWYPQGGMHKIIEGMVSLAEEKGVEFIYNEPVKSLKYDSGKVIGVVTENNEYDVDSVVAACDYHHFDQQILSAEYRNYSLSYWDNRTMAPSSLIFYLGVDKKLDRLEHHNLFFDEDFTLHAEEIYEDPKWPSNPLFYVCVSSKTDHSAAPEGMENVFVLVPVAPDLNDDEETREQYYALIMKRLEKLTNQNITDHVIYKKSYAHNNFIEDYNAFKGNAYGLANTLRQTAILKPSLKNKRLKNLYYTGQLTVPGPGVPPSLISGQVVAEQVAKQLK